MNKKVLLLFLSVILFSQSLRADSPSSVKQKIKDNIAWFSAFATGTVITAVSALAPFVAARKAVESNGRSIWKLVNYFNQNKEKPELLKYIDWSDQDPNGSTFINIWAPHYIASLERSCVQYQYFPVEDPTKTEVAQLIQDKKFYKNLADSSYWKYGCLAGATIAVLAASYGIYSYFSSKEEPTHPNLQNASTHAQSVKTVSR